MGRSRCRWGRPAGQPVRFEQEVEDEQKRHERQGKENRTAVVVDVRVDHFRADMHAELTDDYNAHAISQERNRQDDQGQDATFPRRAQQQLAGDETGQE